MRTQSLKRFFQVRKCSSFSRVIKLNKIWENYKMKDENWMHPEYQAVSISRENNDIQQFRNITVKEGCPRLIISPDASSGLMTNMQWSVKSSLLWAFLRGLHFHEQKEEFVENCRAVFFEILRAYIDRDFSNLAQFTLGGSSTLQFHRNAAYKLNDVQREGLRIEEEDLCADNGYVMKHPYKSDEIAPYFHYCKFVHLDAVEQVHKMENEQIRVFLRYKVILGGVYKYSKVLENLGQSVDVFQLPEMPPDYGFKSPRFTFMELDICQEVLQPKTYPLKLYDNRLLYDFHLHSF